VMHLPIPGVVKFRRARARLNRIIDRIIAERRAALVTGDAAGGAAAGSTAPDGSASRLPAPRGDLVTMLVASTYEGVDGGAPEPMADRQIRDEVLTIFLAGYETVANALSWTWYLLSQNPEAEARMHAELDAVLGTGAARRNATLADYPALQYTEMVFAEAMRLYPPAWAMGRRSTKDITLGPYTIPAGAHFFFSQYVMQRSAEWFPDPLLFDPERHTPEAKAARPRFAYYPFGGGSRQCIGESFAWMEGVLAIATIAQRWRLHFVPDHPVEYQAKISLRPKYPLSMRLEAR
jgi:cytochrome P450